MFLKKLRRRASREGEETLLKKASSDRRRDPRIEEEKQIILEVLSPESLKQEEKETLAKSLDISVGGIRIESSVEVSPDSLIRLHIPSDKLGKWIQVTGRIRWIKKGETEKVIELGLEFIDTPPEIILDLMKHIYHRSS